MSDQENRHFDVAVIGGGLAGLSLSILLAKQHHRVVLFEKEQYPFHKVCGEYISLESWDFLNDLGIDPDALRVPIISRLEISSVNGTLLQRPLPLGGFGISRYILDAALAGRARDAGVLILENTKVSDIAFKDEVFSIRTSGGEYSSGVACGAFGKRSNIDIRWKRPFSTAARNKLNNYIGVKYHIRGNFPADTIALHNFRNGYCGLVKIGDDQYNLCYLTTADNLQRSHGNFPEMEKSILSMNPFLKEIFEKLPHDREPITISQISFEKKSQVENHVLMIGDAAGMITPLCGNGMSMALHAGKMAAAHIHPFLSGQTSRSKMEKRYIFQWQRQFAGRLRVGRRIQRLFGSGRLTDLFITIIRHFPGIADSLVRKTHGKPF